jgi:hypothetical protein
MWAICDGIVNLKEQFAIDMVKHNVDPDTIKKVLLTLKLTEIPSKNFVTKDHNILFYIMTYLIHQLVVNKDTFYKCFNELDKRSKLDDEIDKTNYFNMRRINFEIKNIIEYLDENDTYGIGFCDDIFTLY